MKAFYKLLLLGVAFGVIEASVVIYLRPLFNNDIYDFSINIITLPELHNGYLIILETEIWREIATLVLIFAVAWLVAKDWWTGVCYFVFLFAVWDIIYYVWLYVMIGWPASLMEWDILFLIPKAWYAPVIVPVCISLLGIVASLMVVFAKERRRHFKIKAIYVLLFITAFIAWYISFVHQSYLEQTQFPEYYSWTLFFIGVALSFTALGLILIQLKRLKSA